MSVNRTAAAAVAAILVLTACGAEVRGQDRGSSVIGEDQATTTEETSTTSDAPVSTVPKPPTTKAPTTTTEPKPDPDDANGLTVETGVSSEVNSIGSRYTSVGALITNPNPEFAAYDVTITYNLLGTDGAILDTDSDRVDYIPAGATVPVAPLQIGFQAASEPTDVDVQVFGRFAVDEGWSGVEGFMMSDGIEMVVEAPAIEPGSYSSSIAFNVTNPSDQVVERVSWDCVYRLGGSIVGGDSSGAFDPIAPGASIRVDGSLSVEVDADEIICRATA